MRCSCSMWLAFTTVIYISSTVFTVHGKCSGRWAIHACYGGNGKRSGPLESALDSPQKHNSLLLRQLLMGSNPLVDDLDVPEQNLPEATIDEPDVMYETMDDQISKANELSRVKAMLLSLFLNRKLREVETGLTY